MVHEADEVAVVLEDGEVSGAGVEEGVAEDSEAIAEDWGLMPRNWFLIFSRSHAELYSKWTGYLLWAERSCMEG